MIIVKKYSISLLIALIAFSSFSFSQNLTAISPKDSVVINDTVITFTWNKYNTTTTYSLIISEKEDFSDNIIFTNISNTNKTVSNLCYNKHYYWKIKVEEDETYSAIYSFNTFKPTVDDGLALWLDANDSIQIDNDNTILNWFDKSGNQKNTSQSDISKRPVYIENSLYSYPCVSFDGVNDFLLLDTIVKSGNWRINMVFKSASLNKTLYYIVGLNSGNTNRASIATGGTYVSNKFSYYDGSGMKSGAVITENSINLASVSSIDNTTSIFLNNNISSFSQNTLPINQLNIGRRADNSWYFNGQLAEIMIYNSVGNDSIELLTKKYFQNKYTPPVNIEADIKIPYGFADTTITAYKNWFTSYKWSSSLGSIASTDSVIAVSQAGTYTVTVTDVFGFTSTDSLEVIYPEINYPTSGTDTLICLNDTLWWNTGLSSGYAHQWSPVQVSTTIYPITTAGKYAVKITDSEGNSILSDTITVSIDSFAVKNSLGADRDVCKYESVTLIEQGENIQSWLWSTGSDESFINIETAGTYSVTITNTHGCQGVDTATYSISGVAPNVLFTADTFCFGDSTTFINLSTIENGYAIDSFLWEFGDDSISIIESPKHVYQTIDTFTVTLTAYAAGGCSSFYNDSIVIKNIPTAGFNIKYGTTQCTGTEVTFTDTSKSDITITDYNWLFGTGDASTEQNPVFTYNESGSFTIQQKVTATNGCPDSTTQLLSISDELPLPKPFTQISPNNNSYTSSQSSIRFQWQPSENAINYVFEIAKDTLLSENYTTINTDSLFIDYTLPDTGVWYWQVSALNLCGNTFTTTRFLIYKINPSLSQNLQLWLSADQGVTFTDTTINLWEDRSGHIRNAYQNELSYSPILVESGLNNYPAIRFDGIDDYMFMDSLLTVGSIFIISKWNDKINTFPDYNGLITGKESTTSAIIFSANGGTSEFYSAGALGNNITINNNQTLNYSPFNQYKLMYGYCDEPTQFPNLVLGRSRSAISGRNWKGDIVEVLIYDTILPQQEREDIEQYLRYKYSPPINLTQNINITYGFADTTISAYKPWFTSYKWTYNEDSISADSVITVNQAGTYKVTVTDVFGFTSTDSIEVIYPEINYPILGTDTTLCLFDTLIWNAGLDNTYSYIWQGSNLNTSIIDITTNGKYSVKVIDDKGNYRLSDTITVAIDSFPTQNSLGADRDVCKYESVTLISQGSNIQSYLWNTGATESFITIEAAGEYWIEVTNSRGCIGKDTANYGISGVAPTVFFKADTVCFGDSTTFTNLTTVPASDFISNYTWDFGNDSTSAVENPKHLYQQPDTFVVTLTAVANSGCSNFYSDSVVVNYQPQAGFTIQYGNVQCTETEVNFTDTSVSTIPIIEYNWLFGNGDNSSIQNPTYTYSASGNYNVQQKVTAQNGCAASTTQQVTISNELPIPEPFSLLLPNNNAYVSSSLPIRFEWASSINSISYNFEIAKNNQFTEYYYTETTDSLFTDYILPDTGTWYWKVTAYNLCNNYTVTDDYKLIKTDPSQSTRLQLWLSADEGVTLTDTVVTGWNDLSGNLLNTYQNTTKNSPIIIESELNKHKAMRFDGVDDYLLMDSSLMLGSIFIISKWNEQTNTFPDYNGLITGKESTTSAIIFSANGGTSEFYSAGALGNNITINNNQTLNYSPFNQYKLMYGYCDEPTQFPNLVLGRSRSAISGRNWKGDIVEVLIYDTILPQQEREDIEQYLRYKYSPPINLTQNINITYGFADTTIIAYKPWFTSYNWINNGDTISTDSAITVNKANTYTVTVTDVFGYQSTDSIKVNYPQPNQINDTTICRFDTVTWNPQITGNYSYQWISSTGSHTNAPQLDITEPGNYWVIISDNKGNPWYSDTITVVVNEFPAMVSLGNDTTLCQGNRIYLLNGYELAVSYLWSTGDTTDHFILENEGTYSVTATNSTGCIGIDTAVFAINGIAPTPNFSFTNWCHGDNTLFSDESTSPDGSNIIGWSWNFGDGNSNNAQNAEHRFAQSGIYNVSLIVSTNNNCSNSIRKNVQIYNRPTAQFGPNVTCSNAATEMVETSTATDGNIDSWLWTFPNGTSSDVQNSEFTFTEAGSIEVQLIVQTNLGCLDTALQNIEVKPGPIVDFTFSAGCNGYPVYFTDASESFLNSGLGYLWTFENDNHSTQNNPDYTFSDTGSYNILLEVNQQINNCSNFIEKTVVIQQNPVANFNNNVFCENSMGKLTDISTPAVSPINKWEWVIDSLGVFYGKSIELTFEYKGAYKTELKITDTHGCYDIKTDTAKVYPLPNTHFLTNVNKGPIPLMVEFDNQTTGASVYNWNFGDGNTTTDISPTHVYTDSGTFEVKLLGISQMGCSKSYYSFINTIVPMIDIAVIEVTTETNNGFMQVAAILQNRGTIDLENVEIFYKASYGQTIKEVLPETLHSGQTLLHEFATQMQLKNNIELTHICVTALPSGYTDEIPNDNEKCIAFESAFKPMLPYPNPANNELIIEYIIPFDAEVKINLFNQYGKLTHKLFKGQSTAGFNRHVFDIRTLSKGVYIYRIEYEGTMQSYQLIVN